MTIATNHGGERPHLAGIGWYWGILELLPKETSDRRVRQKETETSLFLCGHFLGFEVSEQVMQLKGSGGSLRAGEGGWEPLAVIQQVTRVAWPCDKGLGNAILTPWQPLSHLSKFRYLQPGFALQSSSLSEHPHSQCCFFCPRDFMASQSSSSIEHVVSKEVSPRACPAPPILLILAPYCKAGPVKFFSLPMLIVFFLFLTFPGEETLS